MAPSKLRRGRPSPAMGVAVAALFIAISGVGYATVALPPGSVGRAQIRNDAVNYQKIEPGSVGIARINPSTVQARVLQTCNTGHSAITAIDSHGRPSCRGVLPTAFETSTSSPVTLGTGSTPIAGEALAGDTSYLVLATPSLTITGTGPVKVTCTLSSTPRGQSLSAAASVAAPGAGTTVSIPLRLAMLPNSARDVVTLSCDSTAAAKVTATATIDALQTFAVTPAPNTVPGSG